MLKNANGASLKISPWYGKVLKSTNEYMFHGEGHSLALAKTSALADFNLQLLSSVQSRISSKVSTLNKTVFKRTQNYVQIPAMGNDLLNIQWHQNSDANGRYYVVGKVQRTSLIKSLIKTLEIDSKEFGYDNSDRPSLRAFFYYKTHQTSIDILHKKILLLDRVCAGYCANDDIANWAKAYKKIINFPKSTCIKLADDMDDALSATLNQWFHQLGFVTNQSNCYLLSAKIDALYFKKDSLMWAQGWLFIKFHSNVELSLVGKVYLKGNSPRSYRSAFRNALNTFVSNAHQKSGLLDSITNSEGI